MLISYDHRHNVPLFPQRILRISLSSRRREVGEAVNLLYSLTLLYSTCTLACAFNRGCHYVLVMSPIYAPSILRIVQSVASSALPTEGGWNRLTEFLPAEAGLCSRVLCCGGARLNQEHTQHSSCYLPTSHPLTQSTASPGPLSSQIFNTSYRVAS